MHDEELKQALLKMLNTELAAMHYYQHASLFLQDNGAIYHFNVLAQEELEHARVFYSVYPGDDIPPFEEVAQALSAKDALLSTVDPQLLGRLNERTALKLAMKMEEEVACCLQRMLDDVSTPAARTAIQENIDSTLGHLEVIKEDYQRIFPEG